MNTSEVSDKFALFFDIDGTILYHSLLFPSIVANAIKKAQKAGHYVFLNTGRSHYAVPKKVLQKVNWDGGIYGGSYAYFHEEKIMYVPLAEKDLSCICDVVEKYKIPTIFDGDGPNYSLNFPFIPHVAKNKAEILELHKSIRFNKVQFNKTLTTQEIEELSPFINCIGMNHYSDGFIIGITKASGMEAICNSLGIPKQNTIAFGDSNNDLEMFEFANYKVAMKKATKELKQIATFIAKHRLFGVYEGIRHYFYLLKKSK